VEVGKGRFHGQDARGTDTGWPALRSATQARGAEKPVPRNMGRSLGPPPRDLVALRGCPWYRHVEMDYHEKWWAKARPT